MPPISSWRRTARLCTSSDCWVTFRYSASDSRCRSRISSSSWVVRSVGSMRLSYFRRLADVGQVERDRPRFAVVGRDVPQLPDLVRALIEKRHPNLVRRPELIGLVVEVAVFAERARVERDRAAGVDVILLPLLRDGIKDVETLARADAAGRQPVLLDDAAVELRFDDAGRSRSD